MKQSDESFKDFVLDDVEAQRMFGGYGVYCDETFFGIIHKGKLYFKIDESTVSEYRKRRMKPFRPNSRQTLKSYYQVPVEIIEDDEQLCQWAVKAIRCQKTPQVKFRVGHVSYQKFSYLSKDDGG